jgi:hypothetical protein
VPTECRIEYRLMLRFAVGIPACSHSRMSKVLSGDDDQGFP